ncbi:MULTISPECIES: hypothetical protein [Methylobacterium]|jgi:hypothetical protein|uniref:hypothetical protein n=1 Tax=Methylobacterium TaxID=407 RepID=UPI0005B96BCC|nr:MULTISPECIES: hypothetical protein [Methylobacterium]MDH3032561.1 hypothetical protein [Methylobacterium fujisawaense]SFV13911.1 hypothetical protein SAMN02799643_05994 [Methylobacterium sp. UNCCL125]
MLDFDEEKSFFERTEEEFFQPYADSHQRAMRDAIIGGSMAVYLEQFQLQSRFITRMQFWRAHQAVAFVNYQGAILNVNVTVAWDRMGHRYGQEVDAVHCRFMQAQRKFMRRHGAPNYNYTVFERSETFGLHSHSGVHVPDQVYPQYRRWLERYVKRIDRVGSKRRLHVRRRRETAVARAIEEQWRWFRYCMKGVNPGLYDHERDVHGLAPNDTFTGFHGLKHRYSGIVTLQRVRVSQDMLRKARREAGYPERYYLIDGEHRYDDFEYRRGEADRLTEMLRCDPI